MTEMKRNAAMMKRYTIRVPFRLLEDRYGSGNSDDAADDIMAWTMSFARDRPKPNFSFDLDTAHANPWFHDFIVLIDGIDDDIHAALVNRLTWERLMDPPK